VFTRKIKNNLSKLGQKGIFVAKNLGQGNDRHQLGEAGRLPTAYWVGDG